MSDAGGMADIIDSTGVVDGNEARVMCGSKEGYEPELEERLDGTGARMMDLRANVSEGEGTSHIAMPGAREG